MFFPPLKTLSYIENFSVFSVFLSDLHGFQHLEHLETQSGFS